MPSLSSAPRFTLVRMAAGGASCVRRMAARIGEASPFASAESRAAMAPRPGAPTAFGCVAVGGLRTLWLWLRQPRSIGDGWRAEMGCAGPVINGSRWHLEPVQPASRINGAWWLVPFPSYRTAEGGRSSLRTLACDGVNGPPEPRQATLRPRACWLVGPWVWLCSCWPCGWLVSSAA
jgi:hypothetical protein